MTTILVRGRDSSYKTDSQVCRVTLRLVVAQVTVVPLRYQQGRSLNEEALGTVDDLINY